MGAWEFQTIPWEKGSTPLLAKEEYKDLTEKTPFFVSTQTKISLESKERAWSCNLPKKFLVKG